MYCLQDSTSDSEDLSVNTTREEAFDSWCLLYLQCCEHFFQGDLKITNPEMSLGWCATFCYADFSSAKTLNPELFKLHINFNYKKFIINIFYVYL
jgi:hypothetical protein